MKHLKTNEELFNFLKKGKRTDSDADVIANCNDILVELSDMDKEYRYKVEGFRRHKFLRKVNQDMFLNEIDIKITRSIPEVGYDEVINSHIKKSVFKNELKPVYDRLEHYLTSQGFKLKEYEWEWISNPLVWAFQATS